MINKSHVFQRGLFIVFALGLAGCASRAPHQPVEPVESVLIPDASEAIEDSRTTIEEGSEQRTRVVRPSGRLEMRPEESPEVIDLSDWPKFAGSPYKNREDAVGLCLNNAYHAIANNELDVASDWLTRAMRISPSEPAVYFHWAEIRKQRGEIEQARQMIDRAMSLRPERWLEKRLAYLLASLNS